MLKAFVLCLFAFAAMNFSHLSAAQDITGYWKTIDEKSQKPKSIVVIYPHEGKIFGRILGTFNDEGKLQDTVEHPIKKAPMAGEPYYAGMDIIWDLVPNGTKFTGGQIMDPEKGKVYTAELWRDGDNLTVRGKILMFGRNQTWVPVPASDFPAGFQKPDVSKFVPKIPDAAGVAK